MAACSSDPENDSGAESIASQGAQYYPVMMDTPGGEVKIPAEAESIFVWATRHAQMLDSMGVQVKAVNGPAAGFVHSKYNPWQTESLTNVMDDYSLGGTGGDPNYEKIASVDPDFIASIPTQLRATERFDRWNSIAPTIAYNTDGTFAEWQSEYLYLAKAVNKLDDANKVIGDITEKYRNEGARISRVSESTYQFLCPRTASEFYFCNGQGLESFGLKPAAHQNNSGSNGEVSKENLSSVVDGDIVFVWIEEENLERLKNDPAWKELAAVKRGSVVYLTDVADVQALGQPSPQSLEWALPRITPKLEQAAKNLT